VEVEFNESMTSVFALASIALVREQWVRLKSMHHVYRFQHLIFSTTQHSLDHLTQLLLPLLPDKEGRGDHDSQQWHSGEQKKRDSGPVGVHPVQVRFPVSSQEIGISGALLLLLSALCMDQVSASSLQRLTPLAQDCFQFGNQASCRIALSFAEELQRSAAAKNRFPCQTMLLGLQADLVLVQLKAGRGSQAIAFLADLQNLCQGF